MAVALNETGYVAVVGDVQYKTLAEALEAVQAGGTVTLLDDVALDATLEIGKNVTLELAGFTVTGNVIVQGDADVTFRGGVMTAVSGNSVIDVKGSAVLNLDGMTVDGGNALNVRSSIHAVVYESVGGLHITGSEILGGTLKHDENCGSIGTNSAAHAVYAYGSSGGSISIENSTLKGGNGKTDATYTGYVSQLFVGGNVALQLGGNAAVEIKNTTIHGGDSDWYNAADAINVSNTFDGTLSISGSSKISGGNALNGTGQNWGTGGQGIYTHQSTGCTQIDIRDSEITGGDGGGSWDGSGIELNKNVSTNIENSTIASGQGAAGGNAGSISINSRVSEVDVTLKDVTLNGDGDGNDVIKGATDGIKIAGEITIAGGTLEDVTFSEIETGTVIKTADTGAVDVSSVTGTTSVPVFNEATGEYEFEPAAVSVNGKAYRTLAEAVAAAQDGDTVTVLGNISGETVTVDKNLTIVGTRTGEEYVGVLNDVIMNAGAGVTLSVKDLKFGGNSYVSAGSAAALNVEGCYADVTPSKITGRSAFIVTGTSEVSTGLLLTVKNNTIIASKGGNQAGDAYAAAIFGWSYLADGSEISGNTFGSETVPYNFIAVKTMNAMAGAVIKVGNNTIYGSNASFDFYAFDFFQNNSRANVYTVLLDGNAVTNANAGTSENSFVFACVEANTGSFGPGHAQVLITGSNTQDGNVVALDQLDLTEGQYSYAGTGVTLDADGKITAGDFAGDLAAVLPALAADLFVTSDGVVQPIAAADVSTLYVNGEWAVTPDTVTGTILDDGKYYDINAYSSASDAFDSFTAENRNIELIGDQLLKTDFDDGGEWPKRNFDLALDGDLTLKAADGAESTLTLTVVDSQNSGGGSTNEVGELAFYSSSADQRATFTLEKGVTIDTNAKIWFGRPTQSSSSDTTPTDIVVNGNIIQQAHDGRYYGILQIQTEKDSTVLVNGSVAFGWTLSVRGAVFTVSSTGEVKASDPASTSSTILVDARSGVGGKFIVDGSKAVSAAVLDVDELGSFEMKNEAAAAFDTVDLAKNATLLVADGSTLTADAVTNAGTIQITGENGKLAVAEGGLTNKGAIVFGASDKTVNTTFDVGMLSKKAGSSAFNFLNGEVTLTGAMADGIRIQPFNVGRNSENVALDAASAIVNIAAGAVVNTHQTYIAENDSVNEHTLNVYGTLNAMTSIYNKQQGNLNIYGTVTANYMQGAGNVLVSGENAVLNLAGNGGNSLLMGRTGRTFRIADGGTVIAGGNVSVGYDEYSGVMEITGGGRLEAQTITVNNSSRLTLDHTASLSFGSITKAANATITVDLSGYTDQFALLIENTGSDATDYASLISNWNELEAAGCTVVGNDLFLGEVDMTVFKVNAGWNGSEFTEEVAPGYRYGINAFDNISAAVAASDSGEIMVVGGTFDGNQFFDGHSAVIAGTAENEVVVNGYIFGGAYNGNTGDASVKITGGSVRRVYGAGSYDQAGTYTAGDIAVEIAEGVTIGERGGAAKVDAGNLTTGDVTITSAGDMTNLFGGAQVWYKGSSATHKSVTVNLTGEMSDVVYAAGQAMHGGWITVENGVTVNVDGGSIGSDGLMGGGFTRSDISETDTAGGITISGGTWINFSAGDISAIYGGTHTYSLSGQLEAVSNITGGTHIAMTGGTAGNVQGGGYTAWGSKSVIDSTEVNISGGTVLYDVQGGSYVVGGGKDAASGNSSTITGDATVRISGDAVIQGNVIGGGWVNWATGTAASTIGGVSTVSVEGGTIHGDVIGGGVAVAHTYDAASSVLKSESAQTVVTLTGGTVKGNVYGGGYAEDAYGKGSAVSSDASGSSVTVAGATVEGDIYAGGFASGENTTSTVTGNVAVTISSGTIKGDVYGGSKGGTVNGDSVITISGGTFDPAKGIYGSDSVKGSSLLNFTNTEALEVGTVSGFASVTLGAGDVKFNAIESEEVNFGGSLSFEEVTEGGITVQKNGTEVMLAAGRKNISSVKSEDVEIGSMGRNGQLTGVEQLVLQQGSELAVTDLTIYGGSSLTITLGSTFSFAGTVDLVDSGFVLNGGNSYLYGAAAVTVDLSGREEGKAYKLVAYTGAGDADFSFVTVDADTVEFNNSLYLADADRSTFYVRLDYTEENALEEGLIFGYNAFNGLNQALGEAAAGPDKIMIAAGTYDEGAAQFVKGVEVVSENAVFSNVWSFGVNSDTGRDFDMETAEKFTVTGDLTVGQFYAEKNANVYVKIDGNLTTVGSFGAKLATQVDVNGTVTVTPPQNGAAQVMVYGTMNVTGTLDVTTGAMGAVLRVGDGRYETEYGKGGVLNVSGADASVVLRNNTGSAIPVTVSAMSSLNISGGATFANETGGMQNLGTVNVDNATLTLGGTLENSGTVTVSGISTLNIGSVNAASGDAHRIQIAAGTTLKDSVIGGEIRVLGDLTVDGELALGNGGIWCGYGSTQTTATISGGMITAKYAMFQYGTYVISADMTLDYGYLSYGGTFTVNSTIKASGQSGEPFYVRGDVTLADGGKLLIDKALWLDYEGAVLTVADGAAVEAGGLKLIADTSMNVNGGSVKVGNTLENNGTFTVSGASTLNIGKLTGNMLQVVADTTLTDSVIGGNVSVGFNAENAADTTLTLAGDTSIGTLYVGKENRTNDYKLVIAGEETTVKLGSLYSRTGSTTTISNGATLDISNYWQSKGTVMVDASTINHSGVNFYVYNNDSADTAAIALMNGAVLNHINAYSLTLGSTNETVSGVAKGNASVTLEGGSTLNVNRLYLNATGTVEEVAGAEAKTSLTAVDSTVTARGEVGIGAGATVSLGNSAFTANTLISSGAIVMDSLSTITCAGAFTSTGTITARVDAAQSGVSFVQKLINASTLTVNDSLTVEGGREGAQLVATGNALWLDNSDKSTILINSEYAGEVGSAIAGRDGYFFGFNALTEYSTSIGADSAVEFTGGSYSFADGFSFTGREFTVSGDTSFDKVTGGAVAVTGGTLSIDTVELTADIAALSGALLAFSGSGMADLANLVLTVSGTMANRTKYVLATGVKDDSFAVTLNGETYELNVRKDGLLVGVENGELYVQKSNDWFMLSRDTVQTVLPEDGYAFGGSDMHESAVMSVERDLNVATNGQNAGARVYGGGLLRNDALFSGTQKCEVTVTAGGVGKGVIGGNRVESGSIGGTLTSSVTIDSADGTFGFIVGGNQLTGGELNGFGGTSVTIQNGTFSMWICGGSVAGGDAAAQVMGNTNVTITGGTFNGTGVFGGGFVQENGTLNQVGNTNVTISGGTFAGNIYGGHGATNKDASPNGVLFGNTNITISGGIFNGNIYGGGFDQSKVQGDTHITFTGTAGADFSVNGIIDGDASNARYWSKGSFVTGDRYLTFDAFTGEFGATLITNIDQMEVTGGSDVNLKNPLDLSEVSQWEFGFGSSLEGFAQNDLTGDTLVLSGWEDQLGDEGWTVMSGSSITGFGEMEVTNGSNLIFAWNADEQYYLGSIGDEQFKLSMEDGALKLAKLA